MTNSLSASKIAEYLLQIKAIKLSPEKPFQWASGWISPIYCDNRVSLSYPEIRNFIKNELATQIKSRFPEVELIAGVATAGIAQGALVADVLGLPFVYVRPEPKSHGRQNQIEGEFKTGAKTVVIEDLISTGKSSLKAVDALRESSAQVLGLASIFSYGFQIADDNFKNANCPFFSLSDYNELIQHAVKSGYVDPSLVESLQEWRKAPELWGK